MVERERLKPIPFLDDLLERYSTTSFSPSRAAAVFGLLAQTDASSLAALSTQKTRQLQDVSKLYRLLVTKDTAVLTRSVASHQRMLEGVASLASTELFLSRGMLAVDNALWRIDVLMEKIIHGVGNARGVRIDGLEHDDIVPALLTTLDVYNKAIGDVEDVTLRVGGISRGITTIAGLAMGIKVREALEEAFVQGTTDATYFVVPRAPDVVTKAFGETHVEDKYQDVYSQEMMHVMEASKGRLIPTSSRGSRPASGTSPMCSSSWRCTRSTRLSRLDEMSERSSGRSCTKPPQGQRTTFSQMGALKCQAVLHCRTRRGRSDRLDVARSKLPDQVAVHSAAIAGHTDIVLLLLGADHLRDLNTRTSHGHESLLMLAV